MQLKDSIQANPTFVNFQYPSIILTRQPHKFLRWQIQSMKFCVF